MHTHSKKLTSKAQEKQVFFYDHTVEFIDFVKQSAQYSDTPLFWILDFNYDHSNFDMEWRPELWESNDTHIFSNQYHTIIVIESIGHISLKSVFTSFAYSSYYLHLYVLSHCLLLSYYLSCSMSRPASMSKKFLTLSSSKPLSHYAYPGLLRLLLPRLIDIVDMLYYLGFLYS